MSFPESRINPPVTTTPALQPQPLVPQQRGPGRFARIFGAIAGTALNLVAPGAGSLVGNLIGGGGMGGDGGAGAANMEAMLQRQQQMSYEMIAVQNRVQTQTQEFTTVSNLLKAKHDGEMSAVHNFKS